MPHSHTVVDAKNTSRPSALSGVAVGDPHISAWPPEDDWIALEGIRVEVYDRGNLIDCGQVDCVTADGAVLWLLQDGAVPRRLVEQSSGVLIRICSP